MDFLKKLLGLSQPKASETDAQPQPQGAEPEPTMTTIEAANQAAREAGCAVLDRHWQTVGNVEQDVLGHAISPSLMGGPHWPSTRQAYRVVRRERSILLASDGLSDPFDDVEGAGNGFELELFVESADFPETVYGKTGDVSPFMGSWAFDVVRTVADTVADAGGINHRLERFGVLSFELPGVSESPCMKGQLPAHFVTEDDCLGVLVGGPAPDFSTHLADMPLSPVTLVPVVVITAAELDYVRNGGGQARMDLVERLQAAGHGHVSNLQRESVI
ncbi:suppressor of fused domain protein [Pseudomonas entomophila]|uniref:suppressor of fused domain protein n=1 Tax=Pseudomonas entomophila TaxID=312306 RepID=UPI001F023F35|nr:suppressor of fused domain protein [Pseudomonas entomophila]MCG8294147.1 suppressor of fused domain protein [Pseudomonas entomophila]